MESDPNGPTHTGLFSLYLDELDANWTTQVSQFDYILLSNGHWFYRPAVFYESCRIVGCHYCLLPNLTDLGMCYGNRKAFRTAFKAINSLKDYKGTTFLRTLAPSHFKGGPWDEGGNCVRTRPFQVLEGPSMEFYMTQVEEFRKGRREGSRFGLLTRHKPSF